ncbi:hypothetical protein FNV43_RR20962 [Rhamnella rubrinervis]|uniref:Uncharacterized protein n=1 Tax=Rhamnella rubrinervis TaxID=2594499 RepID=A0A8K0E7I0_9ROSA|nr:hypothetical protein FNV43_RR20962 [Rhamnella rubrinervis]
MITSADRRGLSAAAHHSNLRLSTFDGRIVAYYGGGGWRRLGLIRRGQRLPHPRKAAVAQITQSTRGAKVGGSKAIGYRLVSTISDRAEDGGCAYRTQAPYEIKVFGLGEYGARLKLKGIVEGHHRGGAAA